MLERSDGRRLEPALWGFRPPWSGRDCNPVPTWINAKAETAPDSRAFGPALAMRRCVIPADAFYEWDHSATPRQPYAIGPAGDGALAMAGIWSPPTGVADLPSIAIVTTAPNELLATIHHRMPVILPPGSADDWLAADAEIGHVLSLLTPIDPTALRMWPVSTAVNSARNDGPHLLARVDRAATLGLV